jgi:cytochrome c peroxidase
MMKKIVPLLPLIALIAFTSGTVDLNNLFNYANQPVPSYITKDNTQGNPITDEAATLGRVLFYDKNLSANGSVACASCHRQAFAFGDTAVRSRGLAGGLTGRHSMRLVNARFADEVKFFWDERATTLEGQTTEPIQDHIEMGFSGSNGDPDLDSLIRKMESIDYYGPLFELAFGDAVITEDKMQQALAQFIRSIQSFDSKFDAGRAQSANHTVDFPNYTANENAGKTLFLAPPPAGGAGCAGCHRPPEFDIDPNTQNNGITGQAGTQGGSDFTNTRAPSLRDIVNPAGSLNGPLMHTGRITTLEGLVEHYNSVPIDPSNTNLDPRLAGPGGNLNLTTQEKSDLIAFLKTLTGSDVYTNEKWSDPFGPNGELDVTLLSGVVENRAFEWSVYPNPANERICISGIDGRAIVEIYALNGTLVMFTRTMADRQIDITALQPGTYIVRIKDESGDEGFTKKLVKTM